MAEGHFGKGTEVEVTNKDEGLKNAWFSATVINSPSKSSSRKKKRLYVEYQSLVEEEGGSKPLREYVDVCRVRPRPPVLPHHSFKLNDVVDAFHYDGWWEGVINKVIDDSTFSVFFQTSDEKIEFGKSDLRLHMEWTNGEWIQPQNLVGNTAQTSEMSSTLPVNPNVANDEAHQEQPSVINSRKKMTIQSMPNTGKSPCNAANYSTLQQDSELLRPDKKLRKEDSALKGYVRTPRSTRAKAKTVATPPMESKGSSPQRKLLFDDPSLGSELLRPDKKLRKEDSALKGYVRTLRSTRAKAKTVATPPMESKGSSPQRKLLFDDPSLGCSCDNPMPTNLGQEEQVEIVTDQLTQKGIDPKKVEDRGKEIVRVPKKRGRPPKKQLGSRDEEPNAFGREGHISQNIDATECIEMPVTAELEGRLEGQYQASREERVDEVTKAQVVSKEAGMFSDSINILEEQPLWIERFYGPINSSGAMPDNQPVSQAEGAVTCTKPVSQAEGAVTCTKAPICNDVLVEHQSLPFMKSLPIWEMIEAQEIFHLLPQKPHFRPLDQFKEGLREGLAIGYMLAFDSLVQKTRILQHDNPRSKFKYILDSLVDLDTYGFQVQPVIEWVNNLLNIRDRQGKLVDESKAIESEINKWKVENESIRENISKMEETLRILRAQKEMNESSINVSQVKLDGINKDIQDANVDFDSIVKPPWS